MAQEEVKTIKTKKVVTKKNIVKKEPIKKRLKDEDMQRALIDNFINLQRVLTNLSIKFDELSGNITKMLQLFEISAKSFAEKYSDKKEEVQQQSQVDKDFLSKLDSLLDQNKTIAKGIMLMEEKIKNKALSTAQSQQIPQRIQPQQQMQQSQKSKFGQMFKSRPLPRY
ncbi:hypothetical protein GOV14_06220 [Candidatus Pacearchaeota archaeon]|nr:hypothetical protein [Candidatus Pacearchaeota archaeon]